MGMFEVSYQFKDLVNYVISSEANVAGVGINSTLLSNKILSSPYSIQPLEMSKMIVDSYIDSPDLIGQNLTMSIMDQNYSQTVFDAINNMGTCLAGALNESESSAVIDSIYLTNRYGPLVYPSYSNSYMDLYQFAYIINSKLSSGYLKFYAQNLLNTYSNFIPYNKIKGSKYASSSGVSIFLTDKSSSWVNGNYNYLQYGLTDFGYTNNWKLFIDKWSSILYKTGQ